MARCSQMAVALGTQAMADAGLGDQVPDPERTGVVVSTGIGGFEVALGGWDLIKPGCGGSTPLRP